MMVRDAPQALFSKVAAPTNSGANICSDMVELAGRSISISAEVDTEMTGRIRVAVLTLPLTSAGCPQQQRGGGVQVMEMR